MSEVVYSVDNKNVSGMISQIVQMINKGLFIGPVEVVLRRKARSQSQNKKMWPMLADVQKQVNCMTKLSTQKIGKQCSCLAYINNALYLGLMVGSLACLSEVAF